MTDKTFMLIGLLAVVIMGCATFIAWRLQRLKGLREEAEKRAVVAFEQMNLQARALREKGSKTPVNTTLPPGQRLQEMYPGPRRANNGPSEA